MESDKAIRPPKHILFLDGTCVFCQRSAQLIHRLDKKGRIHFAPLQGETAEMLPEEWRLSGQEDAQASGAVVLAENIDAQQVLWRGADAVLRTLKIMGGVWSIFWPLHYVPKWLKESVYKLITRNRYRIAGKKDACELPSEIFKDKMLP